MLLTGSIRRHHDALGGGSRRGGEAADAGAARTTDGRNQHDETHDETHDDET